MIQRLKLILLKSTIIIMAFSVIGIPSFYHHCLLRGNHNWQTGFVPNSHNHCVCCEDIENEHIHACSESLSSCCENEVQHQQSKLSITHTSCCIIEVVSLQVFATEYLPKHELKQLLTFIFHFNIPNKYISNSVLSILNFSLPLPYPDFSPPPKAIFLFTQFLL